MQWQPYIYKDGPRGAEHDKQCKHTLQSSCGKYRISRDKLDSTGNYTLWAIGASEYRFKSGTSAWCHLAIYPDARSAQRAAIDHAAAADAARANPAPRHPVGLPDANRPGTQQPTDHPPHLPPGD